MYNSLLHCLLDQNVRSHAQIFHFLQVNQVHCLFETCKDINAKQIDLLKELLL